MQVRVLFPTSFYDRWGPHLELCSIAGLAARHPGFFHAVITVHVRGQHMSTWQHFTSCFLSVPLRDTEWSRCQRYRIDSNGVPNHTNTLHLQPHGLWTMSHTALPVFLMLLPVTYSSPCSHTSICSNCSQNLLSG